VTWRDLLELEPRLAELLDEARQATHTCRRWLDVGLAFAPIRVSLGDLVGFTGKHRGHPVLGSTGAYAVAYWKLYRVVAALLPGRAGAEEAPEKQGGETIAPKCPTEQAATTTTRV
jgi:hypothetical protein